MAMRRSRPPFPGMDPWLEDPDLWPDVHKSLIVSIRDVLAPMVRRGYFARIESRTVELSATDQDEIDYPDTSSRATETGLREREDVEDHRFRPKLEPFLTTIPVPADEIEEAFLTIQKQPGRRPVTVIEILTFTNKVTRDARDDYLKKRRELLRSGVNLVEIDLLRAGRPMPPEKARLSSTYRILIFEPHEGRYVRLYGFSYRTKIPLIGIPLLPGDTEPSLDLNVVLHSLYDRAGYELAIDYRRPPQPRLRDEDRAWTDSILLQSPGESPRSHTEGEAPP